MIRSLRRNGKKVCKQKIKILFKPCLYTIKVAKYAGPSIILPIFLFLFYFLFLFLHGSGKIFCLFLSFFENLGRKKKKIKIFRIFVFFFQDLSRSLRSLKNPEKKRKKREKKMKKILKIFFFSKKR